MHLKSAELRIGRTGAVLAVYLWVELCLGGLFIQGLLFTRFSGQPTTLSTEN